MAFIGALNNPLLRGLGNAVANTKTPVGYLAKTIQTYSRVPAALAAAQRTGGNETAPVAYGSSPSGGGGGYAAPTAADIQRQQSISNLNNALGNLDAQQNVGFGNINNAYQGGLQRLYGDKAVADRNYTTTRNQSTQDNIDARSRIDQGTSQAATGLQRLLGARGFGNSSAARIVAPYAAALQGTQQRSDVAKSFQRNMGALDTNYQDYGRKYNESIDDLGNQKFRQENALRSDVNSKRATLLEQLQALNNNTANQGQIDSLLASLPGLQNQYAAPVQARQVAYDAPDLEQYAFRDAQGPQVGNNSVLTDTISPYLALLMGGRKDQERIQL